MMKQAKELAAELADEVVQLPVLGNGRRTLSYWALPDVKCKTEYGFVSHLEWCKREIERMRRKGDSRVRVVRNALGGVALARA